MYYFLGMNFVKEDIALLKRLTGDTSFEYPTFREWSIGTTNEAIVSISSGLI
jgi:hypothetical protein